MIYIWNNGKLDCEYIFFIETELPEADIVPILLMDSNSSARILGSAPSIDWRAGVKVRTMAEMVSVRDFFEVPVDPAPVDAPRLYRNGPYQDNGENIAANIRAWHFAKYRLCTLDEIHEYALGSWHSVNPNEDAFKALKASLAAELINGWRSQRIEEKWVGAFISECRERGMPLFSLFGTK